jgi:hypothetical protein
MMSSRIGIGICLSLIIIVVLIAKKTMSLNSQHDSWLLQVKKDVSFNEENRSKRNNSSALLNSHDYLFNRDFFRLRNDKMYYNSKQKEENKKKGVCNQCLNTTRLIKEYTTEDVVRCLDVRSAQRNRQPTHIAFVGDSTVRQYFLSFLRVSSHI